MYTKAIVYLALDEDGKPVFDSQDETLVDNWLKTKNRPYLNPTASEQAYDKIHNRVASFLPKDTRLIYSAYRYEHDMPVDNLDVVPVTGEYYIVYGETFQSALQDSPTYLELCKVADLAMRWAWDDHHCFFEGLELADIKIDGKPVHKLCMGS